MSVQKSKKKAVASSKVSKLSAPAVTKVIKSKKPKRVKNSSEKAKQAPKPSKKAVLASASKPLNGKTKDKIVLINTEVRETIEKANVAKRQKKAGKKPLVAFMPPPPMEVSNHPKTKVRNILVSQPKPTEADKNPYFELAKKHHINVTFRQFIKVEGLTSQEFRTQRIEILEHGAVILTSKLAVDHFFRICNEMRVTVPESLKYFCINEQTAYYLQKYIQYRKRKIFFGHGTILDLVDVIRKNRAERFLLPASDVHKEKIVDLLDEIKITYTKAKFYKTVEADLSDLKSLDEFDALVFFTPVGIRSLKKNFPKFKQGNTRIAAFGHVTGLAVKNLGYRLDIFAPNPQNPSMTGALDAYIKEANKR
jgi:uroporphyrinogen-III synthase